MSSSAALTAFLPRHFDSSFSSYSSAVQASAPQAAWCAASLPHHHSAHHHSSRSSHHDRRHYPSSTDSGSSATESPSNAASSPLSEDGGSDGKHRLQQPVYLSLASSPSATAPLLPSPPCLYESGQPPQRPAAPHARQLFINTSLRPAPLGSTPPSSPAESSPLTGGSMPAVAAIRISVTPAQQRELQQRQSRSQPSTPTSAAPPIHQWPGSASQPVSPASPFVSSPPPAVQPKSPVLPHRRVAVVTPPSSPETATACVSSLLFPPSQPSSSPSLSAAFALTFSAEPSLPELLASISMVIHVQLINDQQVGEQQQGHSLLRDFTEYQPDAAAAASVSSSLSSSSAAGGCPSVRSIYQFLLHVFQRGKFSSEMALLALVYLHRVMSGCAVSLSMRNWRPLFMASLCLAQKMWDDTPLINSDFRLLYPQLCRPGTDRRGYLQAFNRLEAQLCNALHWNLVVSSETYNLYISELQAIWQEYEHGQRQTQQQTATAFVPALQQPAAAQPPVVCSARKEAGDVGIHHQAKLGLRRHHPYQRPRAATTTTTTAAAATASPTAGDAMVDSREWLPLTETGSSCMEDDKTAALSVS